MNKLKNLKKRSIKKHLINALKKLRLPTGKVKRIDVIRYEGESKVILIANFDKERDVIVSLNENKVMGSFHHSRHSSEPVNFESPELCNSVHLAFADGEQQ